MKVLVTVGLSTAFLVPLGGQTAQAAANLVVNGDFENSSPINVSTWPSSAGGIGQIKCTDGCPGLGNIVDLPNWGKLNPGDGSEGFAFVINQDADKRDVGASYPNQGGGFPSIFSNDPSKLTNIFLWGPQYGPSPSFNGFTGSPNGGKFLGMDAAYGSTTVYQDVSGFDLSKTYVLSFEYAGAQETGQVLPTTQQWDVKLGGMDFSTPVWDNPDRGFTPWTTYTSSPFSPNNTTMTLNFKGVGGPTSTLPPFVLLDNVRIIEQGPPPSPVPGPLPIVGAGMAYGWARRLRGRVAARR